MQDLLLTVGKLLLSAALIYASLRWFVTAPNLPDVVAARIVIALAAAAGIGGIVLLTRTLGLF